MKARYKVMLDQSLNMMLSAIEVYNKPDFKNREQVFTILAVAGWESLLKAKVLKDNNNKINCLHVRDGSRYKRNRSGHRLTIGIEKAITLCGLPTRVVENLNALIEIRDAAIHLTAASPVLPYLVFGLGSATLQNYSRLVRQWFDTGLSEYNFYILPLGFSYPFKTLSAVDLKKEPEDIANICRLVADSQKTPDDGRFFLVCELQTTLVSAKKITSSTDLVAKVDKSNDSATVVPRLVRLHEKYPLGYREIYDAVKKANPSMKQGQLNKFIRDNKIKGDERLFSISLPNVGPRAAGTH